MNDAKSVMLSLVRAGLSADSSHVSDVKNLVADEKSFGNLYLLCKHHDIAHIAGCALDSASALSDDEVSKKFRKEYFAAFYRYRGMEHELTRVARAFSADSIAHIPLKGAVLRSYYPAPWMRTSCDIDILVRKEDFERASAVLVDKLGYKMGEKCFHDVSFYSAGGVHLELHFDLIEEHAFPEISAVLSDVWEHSSADEGSFTYSMSDAFFYFYHIAHMLKHFMDGGCGVRSFIDLWVLDSLPGRNEEEREALLDRTGLLKFAQCASELAARWMNGAELNEFYSQFADYVIKGGLYGEVKTKVYIQQSRRGGKLGYALRRIFLPYSKLKEIFPVLKRHKWLTPIFEVVRWFKLLFGGKLRRSVNELKVNGALTPQEAENAARMLEELGIS